MTARHGRPKSRPLPRPPAHEPGLIENVSIIATAASLEAVILGATAPQAVLAAARALIESALRLERQARAAAEYQKADHA